MEEFYLNRVEQITGRDVKAFFSKFITFVVGPARAGIANYYLGGPVPQTHLKNLEALILEGKLITESIQSRTRTFSAGQYWEILDKVEDCLEKLQSIQNTGKYLNSSLINGGYLPQVKKHILKQGESIEEATKNSLYIEDYQNSWADIAVKNELREEDYTLQGGVLLSASLSPTQDASRNEDVLGDLNGELFYGIDLSPEIEFVVGEGGVSGDLKTLTPKETLFSSATILANWSRGDNPEFPEMGRVNMVGGDLMSLSYPTIFKNLVDIFGLDDTFDRINMVNIAIKEDKVFIELSIQTKDRVEIEQGIYI